MYEKHNAGEGGYEYSGGVVVKIWFRLHGYEPCSWTTVWEYLSQEFRALGVELYNVSEPPDPENCVELWWGDPAFWRWSNLPVKGRIALALSEARSILAEGKDKVIFNLNQSDLIICPSDAATTAFREAPIDPPIKVVWFGADCDEFRLIERDWDGELRFLHAGVTQFRKGSWLVPEAFVKAFSPSDDVRLTMATPKVTPMFLKLKAEYGNIPNIEFRNGREDTTLSLYEKNHVYVSPHLAEGFGLMIPEAMATGMPCLVARCSAPREFFSDEYGWWIEMSEIYAPVDQCLHHTAGFWRVPDVDSLAEVMREAYAKRAVAKMLGELGADYVKDKLSWKLTAERLIDAIEEVIE